MDRDLVRLAIAGDREAFDALASASIGRLYAVAALILRDPDRAADATQDALVSAWRDLSAIRDPDRFEAWLHRVLVRCCYREAGRERRRRLVEIHAVVDERSGPDVIPSLVDRDQLDRAFQRLDVEERTVIVLHHIEGFLLTGAHCRVRDVGDVWAAGDATAHRPMSGGLAALQADCAAEDIAVRAGAPVRRGSYVPVLRAQLRTGRGSLWLQRDVSDPLDRGRAAREPLWSPPGKIAARRLGAFLAERDVPGGLRVVRALPPVRVRA